MTTRPTQGEPYKFKAEVRERYLQALRLGFGRAVAAESVGLHQSTVRNYVAGNPEFMDEMVDAEQHVIDMAQKTVIDLAREGEFAAAKFILERRDRARWGDSKSVKVEVEGAIDHQHLLELPPNDAVAAIEAEIEKRKKALNPGVIDAEVIEDEGETSNVEFSGADLEHDDSAGTD